jgi:enhancing lycopene biosynthesis protein 2
VLEDVARMAKQNSSTSHKNLKRINHLAKDLSIDPKDLKLIMEFLHDLGEVILSKKEDFVCIEPQLLPKLFSISFTLSAPFNGSSKDHILNKCCLKMDEIVNKVITSFHLPPRTTLLGL